MTFITIQLDNVIFRLKTLQANHTLLLLFPNLLVFSLSREKDRPEYIFELVGIHLTSWIRLYLIC